MTRRRTLLLLSIAVGLTALILVWFARRQARVADMPLNTAGGVPIVTSAQSSASTGSSIGVSGGATNVLTTWTTAPVGIPSIRQVKEQKVDAILATQNNVPIVFYGKLEDQFGNPVVGAVVSGRTIIYTGVRSGGEEVTATSDSSGIFKLDGGKGESLGFVPRKDGYALATTSTEYKFSHLYEGYHVADPKNPVVIKMWKLQGAEPLLPINLHFKLHFTNSPICFDLVGGNIIPSGGDLRITVLRPGGTISEQNPQDWGLRIEVVDGGLIDSTGQSNVTLWAPESGYQANETLTASSNRHGIGLIQQGMFVQSRNGQVFSKLSMSVGINSAADGLMSISFSGFANTNSSRNWEAAKAL